MMDLRATRTRSGQGESSSASIDTGSNMLDEKSEIEQKVVTTGTKLCVHNLSFCSR